MEYRLMLGVGSDLVLPYNSAPAGVAPCVVFVLHRRHISSSIKCTFGWVAAEKNA